MPRRRAEDRGSDTVSNGFRVEVRPQYLPERQAVTESWQTRRYVFAYTIRITNQGERTAQLISRRWIIVNAEGEVQEVRGEGVVGSQPTLEPGQFFEYSSFCPLDTPWGTMEGAYAMRTPQGDEFEIRIGRFYLVAPSEE